MNIETYWSDYTSAEKDLFQKSCRRLLKSTFIVRDKDEENKKAYYFISKKPEPFSIYIRFWVIAANLANSSSSNAN